MIPVCRVVASSEPKAVPEVVAEAKRSEAKAKRRDGTRKTLR